VNNALVGNIIEGKAAQPANAFRAIVVTELGIVTEIKFVQPKNA
jgi:hypothetical protein